MIDMNYYMYADYLDPKSKEPKLVKNAPESARKAFNQAQKADQENENRGQRFLDAMDAYNKREKAKEQKK